jgi:4'-phosphopantetheinyl transferase
VEVAGPDRPDPAVPATALRAVEVLGPVRPDAVVPAAGVRANEVLWLVRPDAAVRAGDGWLSTGEAEKQATLTVPIRRRDWRLRRWTAKEALAAALGAALGPWTEVDIGNTAGGAPEARRKGAQLGLSLSLTDRAGWAACALAPGGTAVGCDLELIEPRSAVFVADWFTPAEQQLVARAADPALAANLLWSAKESALKVLGEGLRRPTRSVEVTIGDGLDPARPSNGWRPFRVTLQEGGRLSGWWTRLGNFVLTVAAATSEPLPAPRFLGGPVPR